MGVCNTEYSVVWRISINTEWIQKKEKPTMIFIYIFGYLIVTIDLVRVSMFFHKGFKYIKSTDNVKPHDLLGQNSRVNKSVVPSNQRESTTKFILLEKHRTIILQTYNIKFHIICDNPAYLILLDCIFKICYEYFVECNGKYLNTSFFKNRQVT